MSPAALWVGVSTDANVKALAPFIFAGETEESAKVLPRKRLPVPLRPAVGETIDTALRMVNGLMLLSTIPLCRLLFADEPPAVMNLGKFNSCKIDFCAWVLSLGIGVYATSSYSVPSALASVLKQDLSRGTLLVLSVLK